MVIEIVEPVVEIGAVAFAMSHQGVDDFAHRQHNAPQLHQILAGSDRPADEGLAGRPVREEFVLKVLDLIVKDCLNGREVPVDDFVERLPVKGGRRHPTDGVVLQANAG